MTAQALYWDSTYEIVLALMEAHADADLEMMGLDELCRRVVSLPGFADDPALVNDGILKAILREWFEESGH